MGDFLTVPSTPAAMIQKHTRSLSIQPASKLPSSFTSSWPPSCTAGFGSGIIDLGGLTVRQVSSFTKIWATHEGGPDNVGATFYEPTQLPQGFYPLGFYAHSNNRSLSGWILVGKDEGGESLRPPVDYTLLWSSESLKGSIKQDGLGYFWLPKPPEGYKAVGLVVTGSTEKPSLDKIRCVRSDLTDQSENYTSIWERSSIVSVYTLRPSIRGTEAAGVWVGTFTVQTPNAASPPLVCLRNKNPDPWSYMPNATQIGTVFQAYAPWIYLHPDEKYVTASVNWYFANGALLYKKGEESKPVAVEPNGANLPQGGANDGLYWLDLPVDEKAKNRAKAGDIRNTEVYLHVKPIFGGTFTDMAVWVFYPFNGPSRAKLKFIDISLGKIGEHIGDWEHLTLRISNFNGELSRVFFGQHSGGTWVDAADLEYQNGKRFVAYSSLNGHAMYPKPGLVLQGDDDIGIRNDTARSDKVVNTETCFAIVAAEHVEPAVVEPPWLNYLRKWGPNIEYDIGKEVKGVEKILIGKLKKAFRNFINKLPKEVFQEEGPTGPKVKRSWSGDED